MCLDNFCTTYLLNSHPVFIFAKVLADYHLDTLLFRLRSRLPIMHLKLGVFWLFISHGWMAWLLSCPLSCPDAPLRTLVHVLHTVHTRSHGILTGWRKVRKRSERGHCMTVFYLHIHVWWTQRIYRVSLDTLYNPPMTARVKIGQNQSKCWYICQGTYMYMNIVKPYVK